MHFFTYAATKCRDQKSPVLFMHHCATVATLPNMIPYIYVADIGIKILRPLATPKIIGLDCQKALKYTNRLARVRRLRGAIFPLVYTIWTQNLVSMFSKDGLSLANTGGGGQTPPPGANNSRVLWFKMTSWLSSNIKIKQQITPNVSFC